MSNRVLKRLYRSVSQVLRGTGPSSLASRVALTILCGVLYGAILGSFGGTLFERPMQSLFAAIKVPLLLLVTFAVSLPSFFVFNTLCGLRSDFPAVVRILVRGQTTLTIVLISLAPYTLLWYATSASYVGAQFFNGLMFAVATFTAQSLVRTSYRPLIARDVRHRRLLRLWLVLYSFVAIQMAWVLRPFIGSPGMEVQFFRAESWGNAYVILGRLFWTTLAP